MKKEKKKKAVYTKSKKIAVVLRIKRQVITCLEVYSVKLACENLQLQQMLTCWKVLGTFGYEFPLLKGFHSRGRVKCEKSRNEKVDVFHGQEMLPNVP